MQSYNPNSTDTYHLHVVKGNGISILGPATSEKRNLLFVRLPISPPDTEIISLANLHHDAKKIPALSQAIIYQHPQLFKSTGLLKNCQQQHITKDITPVQQPIRRVPFHTKQGITVELERLLKLDIIERVTGPTNHGHRTNSVP